jgi:hypothetical protein
MAVMHPDTSLRTLLMTGEPEDAFGVSSRIASIASPACGFLRTRLKWARIERRVVCVWC